MQITRRDSQRQRLYDAETDAFTWDAPKLSLEQIQALIDKVLRSKIIQRRYPRARYRLTVTDGRSRRRGGYFSAYHGSEIRMPRATRTKWYVLHEIAHHLTDDRGSAHGWEFAECYLYLVRVWMGRGPEETLKAQYKAHRVRFRPPRKRNVSAKVSENARRQIIAYNQARAA